MTIERRASGVEFRTEGRRLIGPAMTYGDISPSHRERFEAGAFNVSDGATRWLDVRHQQEQVIAWTGGGGLELTDTPDALQVRATLPDIPAANAALADVRAGRLKGFSVEFQAQEERRDNGVRVLSRAHLQGIGLVGAPSYESSLAEVRGRGGRTLSATIPANTDLECECTGAGCTFANFTGPLMQEMWEETWQRFETETIATFGDYKRPLASVSRGTLRGRLDDKKNLQVEIDLPDSEAGRAVIAANDDAGIVVRPFLDQAVSSGRTLQRESGEHALEYDTGRLRALIVSSTDARKGWPDPRIIATPDDVIDTARSALVTPKRRRIWL